MTEPSGWRRFWPWAARRTDPERRPGETRYIVIPTQTGGVWVTEETAIQISAVWACVTAIAKSLASSTWEVFAEDGQGNREMRTDGRLYRLLNVAPSPEMTAFSFRETWLIHALLWKGGYAEIERGVMGQALALWPLHPDRVEPERDEAGALVYRVSNPGGGQSWIPAADMLQIHGPSLDGLIGQEMARLAARSFGHAIAAETFGAAFYGNGATMGQVLETEQNLTAEQRQELEERLAAKHGGPSKAMNTLLLSGGLKWKQMAIPPENAQFIETRQHLVEEVARWFGVPPHKIGHLLRATFNNIEEQGLEFVRDALTPWAERGRQEVEAKLLPDRERRIKTRVALEWLSEGNAKAKAEADAILVANGIQSRNEVRRRRGLNTVEDGDKLTVQLAMTTLEKIGEDPPPPAEPAPEEGEEGEADEEGEGPPLRVVE